MRINGSLRFDASSASQIENLRVEKIEAGNSLPTWAAADVGRLVYVVDTHTLYVGGASNWVALATGGNAAALQSEVDALETSLGALFNSNGTWNAGGVSLSNVTNPTSLTNLIAQLDAAISGKDTLAELDDVNLTGATAGDLLMKSPGGDWVPAAPGAESGVQPNNDLLTSISGLGSANGILVKNGDASVVVREITSGSPGISITDGTGANGNIAISLDDDLATLSGLTSTGFAVRTGDSAWTTTSLSGTADRIVVTQANGVAGAPTIDLAPVTVGTGGSFSKVTVDGYGRVTARGNVVASDIRGLVDGVYVLKAGDTMSGSLAMGGNSITGLAAPVAASDAATRAYVDNAIVGLTWEAPVDAIVANAAARDALTGLAVGARVVTTDNNTIYTVTATGTPATFDAGEALVDGAAFFDRSTETGYVFNGTTLTQFTGGGQLTAGIGLVKTGNVLDVNLGAGITQLPSDEVGVDLYNTTTGGLILTEDGTTRSTSAAGQLHILTGPTSGLAQSAAGLYIAPSGVTNAMLATGGVLTLDASDSGTGSVTLGGTLAILGNPGQGVTTSLAGSTITISANDATATSKGVASFNDSHFSVATGHVSLAATLGDLTNVADSVDNATNGDLLVFNGGEWKASSASAVGSNIGLDDLSDVFFIGGLTNAGDILVSDSNGTFTNTKIYHLYESVNPASEHTVNHGLGRKYCNVTVVDENDEVVIPQSIKFDSVTELTVTFNTAINCKIVVMGLKDMAI